MGRYCCGRRLIAIQVLEGDSLPFSSDFLYGKNHTITASRNTKICIMHLFQFSSSGPWVTQRWRLCFGEFFFLLLFMNELKLIPIMVLRQLILPSLRSKWSRTVEIARRMIFLHLEETATANRPKISSTTRPEFCNAVHYSLLVNTKYIICSCYISKTSWLVCVILGASIEIGDCLWVVL